MTKTQNPKTPKPQPNVNSICLMNLNSKSLSFCSRQWYSHHSNWTLNSFHFLRCLCSMLKVFFKLNFFLLYHLLRGLFGFCSLPILLFLNSQHFFVMLRSPVFQLLCKLNQNICGLIFQLIVWIIKEF